MSETAKCIHCDKTKAEHTDNPLDFSNCGDWEPAVPAQEAPRCTCPNWDPDEDYMHADGCPMEYGPAEPQAGAQVPSQDECAHAPEMPDREGYWKWVIGGPYQGAVLRGGEIRHLHSSVVKEVFEQARGTKVADVLAGLMFSVDIAEERSRLAFEELNRATDERDDLQTGWDEEARVGDEMVREARAQRDKLTAHLNTIRNYATEAAKTPITREDMHDPLKAQTFFDEAKGFERLVLSEIGGK